MFDLFKRYKTTLIILVLLVGSFFALTQFGLIGGGGVPNLSKQTFAENTAVVGQEIVAILEEIRAIDLNVSVFENPLFLSLQDLTNPVSDEPFGRGNPFDPVGFGPDFDGSTSIPDRVVEVEKDVLDITDEIIEEPAN